jgi:solute carrier family 25 iron transporter 28/37
LHFAVYEQAKEAFGGNQAGYQWLPTAAAGATATLVNDAFMVPIDVVKQRLQVAHSPYKGVADCATKVLRQEGVGALYRSYRCAACVAWCLCVGGGERGGCVGVKAAQ